MGLGVPASEQIQQCAWHAVGRIEERRVAGIRGKHVRDGVIDDAGGDFAEFPGRERFADREQRAGDVSLVVQRLTREPHQRSLQGHEVGEAGVARASEADLGQRFVDVQAPQRRERLLDDFVVVGEQGMLPHALARSHAALLGATGARG